MPDRPSRTGHLAHDPDGMPVFVPDSDPPEEEAVPTPAASPRASVLPGRVQSWALVIVAVLGAGGAPSLVQAIRGDGGQADALRELRDEVRAERAETRAALSELRSEDGAQKSESRLLAARIRELDAELASYHEGGRRR